MRLPDRGGQPDEAERHPLGDLDGDGDGDGADAGCGTAFPSPAGGMACPDTDSGVNTPNCTGYELTANLNFDENTDSAITVADATWWDSGKGWDPIGNRGDNIFCAVFDGNGNTISHLFINRGEAGSGLGDNDVGLFGGAGPGAVLRNITLACVKVTGRDHVGALAGQNRGW